MVESVMRAAKATWDERATLAKQAFDEARAAADAALADRPTGTNTVTAHWEVVGAHDELLAGHGRLADLIVLPGLRSGKAVAELREWLVTALFHTARPILLVPETAIEGGLATIAVACNGTTESARALAGAMPLLLNADQVHVITAATPRTQVEHAAALAEYLGWRGVICELQPMDPEGEVGPALRDRVKRLEAELLVMGGYGRSRVRERIFGGVIQHVLDQHDIPVLLAH